MMCTPIFITKLPTNLRLSAAYAALVFLPACFSSHSRDSTATDAGSSSSGSSSSQQSFDSTTEQADITSYDESTAAASNSGHVSSTSDGDASSSSADAPPPTCNDGVLDADESDVDCGGRSCARCPNGSSCDGEGDDCSSMFCDATGQCGDPRSCNALYDGGVDISGVYTIDPDGAGGNEAFDVYCRMDETGGWTLIAMVNHADQDALPEPNGWFNSVLDPGKLGSPVPHKNGGLASHGAYRLIGAIEPATLVQFELFAEDDIGQIAAWFKQISSPVGFQAWFDDDGEPSLVCTDVDMSQNCSIGAITSNGSATYLGGMNLSHYGYSGGAGIHMRDDNDTYPESSAVCSHTFDADGNAWDDNYNTHWGNGLRIWFR
jgi:hypothetical protein